MPRLSRRSLVLGATALAGCKRAALDAPLAKSTPLSASSHATIADWQALGRGLSGELIMPDHARFPSERLIHNARFDSARGPLAIVRCLDEREVQDVIAFARRFAIPIAARSGGHSYAGYSLGAGIVIDTAPMSRIAFADGNATVGAGALLVDVYDELARYGVSIPGGTCPSVGIAGLTLGGGMGVVGRKYGLTCDRLIAARVVTADGRVIACDDERDPDLYWALRGGGGGNFGVVTELSFRTYRLEALTTFRLTFRWADAARVVAAWQVWGPHAPDEVWSALGLSADGKSHELPEVELGGALIGKDLDVILRPLLEQIKREPISETRKTFAPREIVKGIADCEGLTISQCHKPGRTPEAKLTRSAFVASSDIYGGPLSEGGIETMLRNVAERQAAGQKGMVLLDALGGAINHVKSHETAFVHRNDHFTAQYLAGFPVGTEESVLAEADDWIQRLKVAMRGWSTGRAYQNYIDARLDDWRAAYYGDNYPRLAKVRAAYDPTRMFRFPQGID